jgi:ribosomal protein S27E
MNFTLAHELAHIFLEHLNLPDDLKSKDRLVKENLEADEFAGRLLMPEELLLKSNFTSESAVSLEYLVSEQALFKRVNNLKRLDLFKTSFFRHACVKCGNRSISPAAMYCVICGTLLTDKDKKGVKIIEYDMPSANDDLRVNHCLICDNEEMSDFAVYCRICGTPLMNHCAGDDYYLCNNKNVPHARYCEICGENTVYLKRGVIKDWKVERREYIKSMTHK